MNFSCNEILEGLYLGSLYDARNNKTVSNLNISHFLSILDSHVDFLPGKYYLCVNAEDNEKEDLSQYFSVCNDFIHSARAENKHVLVHCLAGVSRSVTIVCAYLLTISNMKLDQVLQMVRSKRFVANPNQGFLQQLKDFEANGLAAEKERLNKKFPIMHMRDLDESRFKQFVYLLGSQSSDSRGDNAFKTFPIRSGLFNFSIVMPPNKRNNSSQANPRCRVENAVTLPCTGIQLMENVHLYTPENIEGILKMRTGASK